MITTPAGDRPVVILPSTGRGYFLEVKGESHYQETLNNKWLQMRPERELSVRLTAEPSNSDDPYAVAVQTFAGETVGYLPREEAARYQQLVLQIAARDLICICQAKLVGGTAQKKNIGMFLDVEAPTIVASKFGLRYERVPSPSQTTDESTVRATAAPSTARQYRRPQKHETLERDLPIDDESHIDLGGGKGWTIGVVGESRRQTALRNLSAGRRERDEQVNFLVELVPEPTNPVDVNAIRVDILGSVQVGYLAREDAAAYRLALMTVGATGKKGVCRAKLIGGTPDKPSIGVMIDLLDPDALLGRFGQPF